MPTPCSPVQVPGWKKRNQYSKESLLGQCYYEGFQEKIKILNAKRHLIHHTSKATASVNKLLWIPSNDKAAWTINLLSLSASCRCSSWVGSNRITVWKLPSPAWAITVLARETTIGYSYIHWASIWLINHHQVTWIITTQSNFNVQNQITSIRHTKPVVMHPAPF